MRIRRILLGVVLAVWLSSTGGAQPGLSLVDEAISNRFQERRETVLDQMVSILDAKDLTKGGFLNIAAALQRGEHREVALARLRLINEPMPTANMFWTYLIAIVMATGHDQIDAPTWARIQELWKIYWPSRGDTENHWVVYYAGLTIAAQLMPEAGPDEWFNGKSSDENQSIAREYLLHWIAVTTSYGQGEYDSPGYLGAYLAPLSLLAGFADDFELKEKARMMLDYLIYDYAVEHVDGFYGGAHSRIYPHQILAPGRTPSANIGWLLFGFGKHHPETANRFLALSGYEPPPILERIARDRDRPYVERELKRTRWRMRNAGPRSIVIGDRRSVPVYKYSYVDRDFVFGSSQGGLLQPIQQQTWSLVWRTDNPRRQAANTFFAVQPYSSFIEGTMYFAELADTITDIITRSKIDYDSEDKLASGSPYEQVMQHGTALIALYDLPEGGRFPHITTFFSRDLEHTDADDSGWIFSQGGPLYIAYRPFAPGVWKPNDWTGLIGGEHGGSVGRGFSEWGVGHQCLVSNSLINGYIVQVAPVRDYADFDAFKKAVRALPLSFSLETTPEAAFTTLDGTVLSARYGDIPTVNGVPVDYANWPLFDGPYAYEKRESRRLDLHYGDERYLLDFTQPAAQETEDAVQ
jgi:hypothetical protein